MSNLHRGSLIPFVFCLLLAVFPLRAAAGETVINFLSVEPEGTFEPLMEAYAKATPGVTVRHEYVPFGS